AWLSENCRAPLFVDPVSTIKAEKIKNLLGRIHTLKPNKLEAEYLSGIKIADDESLERATEKLLSTGLKRVFISLGSEGAYCAEGSERVKLACPEADLVNTTGGGDAFMAGLVWAWLDGRSLEESGKTGLGAGAVAVEAETTINPEMCIEKALAKGGLKR
ncbi:MAG TPA: bifunctional hydroxymethylpyrimidine kinase/phosphomethylpyrimidine kinase, partial [Candidatus Avanaerovorax faecigallinarum]|nr:bifunctional hydroxymethylpyrimidine kinase/phosphomethylpyrimidine kinase [Candidatus Avanaerovorax faecigallinarum]